jgi:hypothetical protein
MWEPPTLIQAPANQLRRHPMLSNGRMNTFPQQRSHPRFSVNSTRFHGSSSANTGNEQLGKVSTTRSEKELLKPQQIQQRKLTKTTHNTQRRTHRQSESNKRATYFNQQPANLQAEVRSYILYTYTINIRIKDSYVVVSSPINKNYIGDRQNPTNIP